jgi:hypothetical protein
VRAAAGLGSAPLERLRERPVQLGPLARQQVVLDDLAQQRVAEGVAALGIGDDDLAGDRLAQPFVQLAPLDAGGVLEQAVVEPAPDREHAQQLGRRRREALDAHHQRVAKRGGQRAAPVEAGGEQLLGEQRVALAARVQALDELGGGRCAQDVGERFGELLTREPRQLDPAGARVALELGEHRAQRVAAMQLVGPVGGDDEDALGAERAGEEGEEAARGGVGPVDVLDREHQRRIGRKPVEQGEQRLEDARLRDLCLLGAQPRPAAELREEGP